jgi:hypothetical protein
LHEFAYDSRHKANNDFSVLEQGSETETRPFYKY